MTSRRCFALATLCTAALLAAGTAAAQGREIVIGQSVPLTGPLAAIGASVSAGTQAYFDQVNAAGGINGAKLKLVTLDDGFVPERSHENVKKLIGEQKAVAIVNVVGAPNSEGLVKQNILSGAKVPLVGPYTASVGVRDLKSPYIYFVAAGAREEANAMVRQARSMGLTRLGVMYQNDLFGRDGNAEVTRAAKEQGAEVIATGAFERNAENIDKALGDLGKAQPQAIFMFAPASTSAKFVAQYRKAHGLRAVLISSSGGAANAIVDAAGTKGAAGVGLVQVVPSPGNTANPLVAEYQKVMNTHGPKDWKPSGYSMQGFITGKVVVEGFKRGGGKGDSASLMQGLDAIHNWQLGSYTIDYSGGKRLGSRFSDIGIIGPNGKLMN